MLHPFLCVLQDALVLPTQPLLLVVLGKALPLAIFRRLFGLAVAIVQAPYRHLLLNVHQQ